MNAVRHDVVGGVGECGETAHNIDAVITATRSCAAVRSLVLLP
jgi:hypothetical protein